CPSVAVVYLHERLTSGDSLAGLRVEHYADGGIDAVGNVRASGTQQVRRNTNRAGFDGSHEPVAWCDVLFAFRDRRQQRIIVDDPAVAALPLDHAPQRF